MYAKSDTSQQPEIDSYLALPYSVAKFKEVWHPDGASYVIEIRMREHTDGRITKVSLLKDPASDNQKQTETFLRLSANNNELKKLSDYLESAEGQSTTLLYVIFGMTKDPVEHLLAMVPDGHFDIFFIMNKGIKIATGDGFGIQDIKNGRVVITT